MPRVKQPNKKFIDIAKKLDGKKFATSVQGDFKDFPDHRNRNRVTHPIWYILFVVLAGTLAGCNTIQDLADYARYKKNWFLKILAQKIDVISYDTLWWFFVKTNPETLKSLIQRWFNRLPRKIRRQLLAIDGKRVRGASKFDNIVHLVELYASESGLVITQERVPDKTNELAAIPAILESVDVKGAILSLDALFAQKSVVEKIIEKEAEYLISLKGNQGNLHAEIINFFEQAHSINFEGVDHETQSIKDKKAHGRVEKRTVYVVTELDWLPQLSEWKGLTSIIEIVTERKVNGKVEITRRYYISSAQATAAEFLRWIRQHWHIENGLHWVIDVIYREDAALNRTGNSVENMALVRRLTTNVIRCLDPDMGMASARRCATYEEDYLHGLLGTLFTA